MSAVPRPGSTMFRIGSIGALVVAAALIGLLVLNGGSGADESRPAPGSPPDDVTSTGPTSTTTTTTPVERRTLPAGTHEIATARADRDEVLVSATPPPGWNSELSPVVVATTPRPPRSSLDTERVALPSPDVPIAGRRVVPGGWALSNPSRYRPPQPLRLGVVERQGDWAQVQLPVRPNGTTGWIATDQVDISSTTRSVEVSLTDRRLRVLDDGAELLDVPVAIGRPATPTPTGSFTVTDIVPSANPTGPYGPVALALDGYSEVLDRFGGESAPGSPDDLAPVLALHGTNRPGSVGRAQSNGCPRLFDEDVVQLAQLVPAGTPVLIWP